MEIWSVEELSYLTCRYICRSNNISICRPDFNQQTEKWFSLQIKVLSASQKTIWSLKIFLDIKELSAYWSIGPAHWKSICGSNNCLQIEELSVDWRSIDRSKNYLQINEVYADQWTFQSKNNFVIWISDTPFFCSSNCGDNPLICIEFIDLWNILWYGDSSLISR